VDCLKWWPSGLIGDVVGRLNEVNQRQVRLVLGPSAGG